MNQSNHQNYGQDEYLDISIADTVERNYKSSNTNFAGVGPKGYKRSDERIQEEVCDTLMKDRDIDASDIEVKVKNGTVVLSGTVASRSDKFDAEMAIEKIVGIEDIQNNIKLRKWSESSAKTTY
ncbi:MAG: BON domain-containing protein [Bacteriovorax sp.]|nr:BON domain-containing protein [Bacteriovorax sp.]